MNYRVSLVGAASLVLYLSVGSLSGMQNDQNFFERSKNSLKRLIQDTKSGSAKAEDFEQGFEVFQTFSQNSEFKEAVDELRVEVGRAIAENSSESLEHMGKTKGYFSTGMMSILSSPLIGTAVGTTVSALMQSGGVPMMHADGWGFSFLLSTVCVLIAYGIKKCGFDARIISTLRGYNDELRRIQEILTNEKLTEQAEQEAIE